MLAETDAPSQLNNEELTKENRSLKRQLRNLESVIQRYKAMVAARTAVNSMLESDQKKMEHNMALLLENSTDIILLFDNNGCFSYFTNTFMKATGITSSAIITGRHFTEVFCRLGLKDWSDFIGANFDLAMKQRSTVGVNSAVDLSGGADPKDYDIRITPMMDKDGNLSAAMMLFHDMTDIMRSKEQAESASRAKSRFLAAMSHEMRTPLNAVLGMTAIGKAAADRERMLYCYTRIEDASQHLLGVINDVLDMSKIESGKFELVEAGFSFDKMLQRIIGIISFKVNEKRQVFTQSVDCAIPDRLLGDEQRLSQVISNLLGNAVKFTPDEGSIDLSARLISRDDEDCLLRIAVSDTGIGISPEQQARLFQPFQQAENDISRKFGGTGLGLAISKNIVDMMGGGIGVESELGRGATFAFTVKLTRDAAAERDPEENGGERSCLEGGSPVFPDRCVLLAEDVDINREIVMTLLEPTGLRVVCAENGTECVRLYTGTPEKYDMIFMDVQMPEMDGYEATRRIRMLDCPGAKTIPIIAMTANVFREDIEKCLEAGMNGHIGKPIDFEEVLRNLREYLPV